MATTSLVLAGAVASLLFAAQPAAADSCRAPLADSLQYAWDTGIDGEILNGTLDAYDGWGSLRVSGNFYPGGDTNGCTREDDGREIAFPTANIGGLVVSRKIYVPPTGPAFARFLDVVNNPTGSPISTTVSWEGNLGSDSGTTVLDTSNGDTDAAVPDTWATSADDTVDPTGDPPLAHVWDGPGVVPDSADAIYGSATTATPWVDGGDYVRVSYNVTVPAGATYSYMHLEAQRGTIAEANQAAALLGDNEYGSAFAGLSNSELASIRNWNTSDVDNDGVNGSSDNCPFDSNPSQSDIDHDGSGDTCDGDIDGDGVSNSDEAARGTDAGVADTDGDGKPDGADSCPTKPGQGTDGCPRFDTAPPTTTPPPLGRAVDSVAPKLTLKVGRVVKRALFLKGLTVAVVSNEATSLDFELRASVKKVQIAKAFNLTLASQSLPVGSAGTRAVRLRPAKALIGKARKFTALLRVVAQDRSGNKTVRTAAIAVR